MSVCPLSVGLTLRLMVATCPEKTRSAVELPTRYGVHINANPESERALHELVDISGA